jgi:hypothetical protein
MKVNSLFSKNPQEYFYQKTNMGTTYAEFYADSKYADMGLTLCFLKLYAENIEKSIKFKKLKFSKL